MNELAVEVVAQPDLFPASVALPYLVKAMKGRHGQLTCLSLGH